MKLLLVAGSKDYANVLGYHLKPLGFELEQESDPVRAIERFEKVAPHTILFDAIDFPRHWKPFLKLVREKKPRDEVVFLLIAGPEIPLEDVLKAAHLGVNGILGPDLSDKKELYRLEEIIRRYRSLRDRRNYTRLVPSHSEQVGFAFTHPIRRALVMGSLSELSIQGSSFLPGVPGAAADLPVGMEIPHCALRVEETIITVDCRLTRNREELGFQFTSFSEGGHSALLRYVQTRAQRDLKIATTREARRD